MLLCISTIVYENREIQSLKIRSFASPGRFDWRCIKAYPKSFQRIVERRSWFCVSRVHPSRFQRDLCPPDHAFFFNDSLNIESLRKRLLYFFPLHPAVSPAGLSIKTRSTLYVLQYLRLV